jgi:hypothetical protein
MNHLSKLIETLVLYRKNERILSDVMREITISYNDNFIKELEDILTTNNSITLKNKILNKIEQIKKDQEKEIENKKKLNHEIN